MFRHQPLSPVNPHATKVNIHLRAGEACIGSRRSFSPKSTCKHCWRGSLLQTRTYVYWRLILWNWRSFLFVIISYIGVFNWWAWELEAIDWHRQTWSRHRRQQPRDRRSSRTQAQLYHELERSINSPPGFKLVTSRPPAAAISVPCHIPVLRRRIQLLNYFWNRFVLSPGIIARCNFVERSS